MKFPPPKTEATQAVLGPLFDKLDKATDYADCLWHAAAHDAATAYLAAVADDLHTQLKAIKETVHDLVAWAN